MSEDNFKAGAFYIDAFSLVNQYNETVDIRGLVINFQLFESIFKKFVKGEVSIFDGMNLLKNFRFTGQEFIRISIKQRDVGSQPAPKEFSIDKTFTIVDAINHRDGIRHYKSEAGHYRNTFTSGDTSESHFKHETDKNEEKRKIKVIRPEFIKRVVNEFERIMLS